jgi:hypothetical protein
MTNEQRSTPETRQALRRQLKRGTGLLGLSLYRHELTALLDDADALAGALAEADAWRALVEDTDHRLKRYNGDDGYITGYYMTAGIWYRFLSAARGGDVRGIVSGLEPETKGTPS